LWEAATAAESDRRELAASEPREQPAGFEELRKIDQLLVRFADDTFCAPGWEAVRAIEHAAPRRGDVPYFLFDRRTRDLLADGRVIIAAAL
jgi:hypothetical protein